MPRIMPNLMNSKVKTIGFAVLFALLFGFVDSIVDYFYFYDDTFLDILIFAVPGNEIFIRFYVLVMMIVFGFIISLVVDQTRKSEAERTASKDELNSLVESTGAIPWKVDVATRKFVYIGAKIGEMTGYPPRDWVDFAFWSALIHPDDRNQSVNYCLTATSKGEDHEFSYRLLRKDGETIWIRDSVYVEMVDGKPLYLRGFFFDITRDMATEIETRKLEAQLRHAQKMESMGQLAGGIAHDFNNFLTTIIGYSELIMMDAKTDDPYLESISEILSTARKAANMIKSLLAFSRKQVLAKKPVSLNRITTDISRMLARILGEDIRFETVLPDEQVIINADPGQIEQIAVNMAANARDAMAGNGSFRVEVSKTFIDQQFIKQQGYGQVGEYGLITFSDSGEGIPPELCEKIFDPFFTTKEKGKGTGLGLSIVHGIVNQHGGFINVYSEKSTGTTFKIMLPCSQATPTADKQDPAMTALPRGQETILLAEDEESVRNMLANILRKYGYRVISAIDGLDAIAKFHMHQEEIGLIILDMIMPGCNGKEVLEEIHRQAPAMKALFISGYNPDTIAPKGLSYQNIGLLAKPVLANELLTRVRVTLDHGT